MIHKKELTSSCLCEATYDDEKKTLTLMFARDEHTDTLRHIPKRVFDELCEAESPGSYYNYHIRGVEWKEDSE